MEYLNCSQNVCRTKGKANMAASTVYMPPSLLRHTCQILADSKGKSADVRPLLLSKQKQKMSSTISRNLVKSRGIFKTTNLSRSNHVQKVGFLKIQIHVLNNKNRQTMIYVI